MKINVYYGGRGLLEDPTLFVVEKIIQVLQELRVEVTRYNMYEDKSGIATLPNTLKDCDGVILAASLWHDWVEEGQSPRARKIVKDWEWNIDEMAHAVNVKGRLIGYRVLQAGVIIYLGYSRFFRGYRSIELSVLAIVSIVAEVLFIIIKTIRNMAGDEDKTQMWKQMGHSVFNNLMYLWIVVNVFWM